MENVQNGVHDTVHDGVQDVQAVIDWLEQVKKLDELIDAKTAERDQLWALATKITPEMSDMPHSSGVSDKVGNMSAKLADLARETNEVMDQYINYKASVVAILEKLPANEYGVLHRYYIRYMTWEEVAADMNVCGMTVWRWWQKGLKNLQSVMECYTIPMV